MANNASEIIKYLYNIIGCDNFLSFIRLLVEENYIDKRLAQNLTKPFQQKEKKDRATFQELVKEQRKKMVGSKTDGAKGQIILVGEKENAMGGDSPSKQEYSQIAKKIMF